MTTVCNQFVFGFHPQKGPEIRRSSTVERSRATALVCSSERSRNGSGSSASLPPASPIPNADAVFKVESPWAHHLFTPSTFMIYAS